MIARRLLDTNLIVRHLVQDHPKHAKVAEALFLASDRGEITLVLLSAVVAECVFVLESFYEHPRKPIAAAMQGLINSPGILVSEPAVHVDALDRFKKTKVHFVDCLIAATAASQGAAVATFDRDFRIFGDVRVETE